MIFVRQNQNDHARVLSYYLLLTSFLLNIFLQLCIMLFIMISALRPFLLTFLTRRSTAQFALLRFPLPDLGEKIKQGRVKKLYIKEGDQLKQFEKVADVQSDRQFIEVTAPSAGIMKKLYYQESQICRVGDIFFDMDVNTGEQVLQVKSHSPPMAPVFQPIPQPSLQKVEILASATVRLLARQHKINLEQLKGTGLRGRILKDDIVYFLQDRKKIKPQEPVGKQIIEPSVSKLEQKEQVIKVQMNEGQKQLYKLFTYSTSIPHLYLQQTFNITQIFKMIQLLGHHKAKISLLSILIKTFSLALLQHPRINSTYSLSNPFNFKTHPTQNILIPFYSQERVHFGNVADLQTLSIHQIQNSLAQLEKNPSKTFNKEVVENATICISNLGSVGGIAVNPLIIGEQCCHASIGKTRDLPASLNGQFSKQNVVDITLGCDHRVLDGASVARFALTWKQLSQNPTLAFLKMV